MGFTTKPLTSETWPDFASLVEDHNGVWGGCWCLGFHDDGAPNVNTPEQRRRLKEARVRGRTHSHRGVADAALAGALDQIMQRGGGLVESYPEETAGRKVSGSFLNNVTVSFFERHGFERDRPIGKHHWVVTRQLS